MESDEGLGGEGIDDEDVENEDIDDVAADAAAEEENVASEPVESVTEDLAEEDDDGDESGVPADDLDEVPIGQPIRPQGAGMEARSLGQGLTWSAPEEVQDTFEITLVPSGDAQATEVVETTDAVVAPAPVQYSLRVDNTSLADVAPPIVVEVAFAAAENVQVDDSGDWDCDVSGETLRCVNDQPVLAAASSLINVTATPLAIETLTVEGGNPVADVAIAAVAAFALMVVIGTMRRLGRRRA